LTNHKTAQASRTIETREMSSNLTKDLNQLLENGVDDSTLDYCKRYLI